MSTSKFSTSSALMAIGMVCASVAMLMHNSTAAASHVMIPVQRVSAPAVTELPPVVIIGKRLKTSERANYLQQRRVLPATIV